jgi:hypothetical protein
VATHANYVILSELATYISDEHVYVCVCVWVTVKICSHIFPFERYSRTCYRNECTRRNTVLHWLAIEFVYVSCVHFHCNRTGFAGQICARTCFRLPSLRAEPRGLECFAKSFTFPFSRDRPGNTVYSYVYKCYMTQPPSRYGPDIIHYY